ncbi:MAG: hypothetical protein IID43_02575 [Planctomycetes bacterium]|nr:hypothetical protein [Planctomycetota bacterium]
MGSKPVLSGVRVRGSQGDTPVRVGDVNNIEVPEHHYSGYISLGVVEHREEGPEPFLREALRVLSDDGEALISVPYFNPMRRAKAKLGFYRSKVADDASFYQYAYIPAEFVAILESEGFRVVERVPYSVIKGAKDEIPGVGLLLGILRRIARRGGGSGTVSSKGAGSNIPRHPGGTKAGRALDVVAERLPFTIFAHMMLFVCVKRDSS